MSTIAPNPAGAAGAAKPQGGAIAVLLLAISAFVIVTTEFIIVGLLPALARDLDVSVATAGYLVTLFAFTVMLFGPVLTGLVSHFDRKRLFVVLLLIFAGANALAAAAPNIWILALARFIPAVALPVFWGTASETAGEIAGPERSAKAVANVYMGIAGAMVFGIPLGTLVGDAFGWRGTFWILALLSLVMAGLLAMVMPTVAKPVRVQLGEQLRILRDSVFLANLALSILVFTAMFTAYTYLADLLEKVAAIAPNAVGWWLMGFDVVGLGGNWLGGYLVGRNPLRATFIGVAERHRDPISLVKIHMRQPELSREDFQHRLPREHAQLVMAQPATAEFVRRYAQLHNIGSTQKDPEGRKIDAVSIFAFASMNDVEDYLVSSDHAVIEASENALAGEGSEWWTAINYSVINRLMPEVATNLQVVDSAK